MHPLIKWLVLVGSVVAILLILGLISYETTQMIWDGGFPSGEIRLNVRNQSGAPVIGARLNVYDAKTGNHAFGYPLDDYVTTDSMLSDNNGRITAIRRLERLQFGGHAWKLWWLVPIQSGYPEYKCEVVAPGYEIKKFKVEELFKNPYTLYEDFPKTRVQIAGEEVVLKVYENTIALER